MSEQVPIVDYLVLEESPYLEVNECTNCAARFLIDAMRVRLVGVRTLLELVFQIKLF